MISPVSEEPRETRASVSGCHTQQHSWVLPTSGFQKETILNKAQRLFHSSALPNIPQHCPSNVSFAPLPIRVTSHRDLSSRKVSLCRQISAENMSMLKNMNLSRKTSTFKTLYHCLLTRALGHLVYTAHSPPRVLICNLCLPQSAVAKTK